MMFFKFFAIFGFVCGVLWSLDIILVKYINEQKTYRKYKVPLFAKIMVIGAFAVSICMTTCIIVSSLH